MSLGFATNHASAYTVTTSIYEGPLDLLLQLIERAELDITSLALAQVTDQYLAHLRALTDRLPEEVSAFLVIASRLLQIKSEMLLPRSTPKPAEEEDAGEALARQLLIYKQFKEAAGFLARRQEAGLRTYLRLAPPPKIDAQADLSELTLDMLLAAARSAYATVLREDLSPGLSNLVTISRVTIEQKISQITGYLRQYQKGSFLSFLGERPNRLEVVLTFLALLELVKRHFVLASQNNLFGDIELEPGQALAELERVEIDLGD